MLIPSSFVTWTDYNADLVILGAFRNNRENVADFLTLRPSVCLPASNNAILLEWLVMNFYMNSCNCNLFTSCASVGVLEKIYPIL